MFCGTNNFFKKLFKKIIFQILANFAKVGGTLVTVTLTVTVKTFSLENVAKMKLHSPNIYRRPLKKFGQHFP